MGCCQSIPANLVLKDIPPFIPPIQSGRVVKVYDGDTITVAAKLEGTIYKFSVRLAGIDAPELRTSNPVEKRMAQQVQQVLSNKLMGKMVYLKNRQKEKYGRLLCDVYLKSQHINQWLVDNRYAVKYNGGTKHPPKCWQDYYDHNVLSRCVCDAKRT